MLNIEGALYFCTFFLGIVNSLIVQPVAAAQRTVFYRERAAHMYSVLPYVLSLVRAHILRAALRAVPGARTCTLCCPTCCPWCAPGAPPGAPRVRPARMTLSPSCQGAVLPTPQMQSLLITRASVRLPEP